MDKKKRSTGDAFHCCYDKTTRWIKGITFSLSSPAPKDNRRDMTQELARTNTERRVKVQGTCRWKAGAVPNPSYLAHKYTFATCCVCCPCYKLHVWSMCEWDQRSSTPTEPACPLRHSAFQWSLFISSAVSIQQHMTQAVSMCHMNGPNKVKSESCKKQTCKCE